MKLKVVLFIFLLISASAYSQRPAEIPSNFFMTEIGGGTSSLQGWSAFSSFSYERKNNLLTLSCIYNNQIGHKKVDFFGYDYYNDRFSDIAILYGRTFRKSIFFASLSVGPSFYGYTNKTLVSDTVQNNWLNNDYDVDKKYYSGISLACESKLLLLIDENVGVGALFWTNINKNKPLVGASISLVFGMLRN